MEYISLNNLKEEELKLVYTEEICEEKLYKNPKKQKRINLIAKQIASDFLKFLDEQYNLSLFLYAGSGWDKVPKETIGLEKVIHLSLEEIKGDRYGKFKQREDIVKQGYFGILGEGLKVQGDFRKCPFKDETFKSCYIHYVFCNSVLEAREDITRVLKKDGLLIIAKTANKKFSSKKIYEGYKMIMKPQKVKHEFANKFYVLKK